MEDSPTSPQRELVPSASGVVYSVAGVVDDHGRPELGPVGAGRPELALYGLGGRGLELEVPTGEKEEAAAGHQADDDERCDCLRRHVAFHHSIVRDTRHSR